MNAVYAVLKNHRNIYLQMKQVISPLHCRPAFKLVLKGSHIREQVWAACFLSVTMHFTGPGCIYGPYKTACT